MRTTIISKSKIAAPQPKDLQKDGPLRYDYRFIGLVRKVRGAANADNDNIEVQKSRLLKPLSDVVIPQIPSLAAQIINHEGATYYGNL